MARTRYLKPSFHEDKRMAKLSIFARYIYENMWCYMDRNGLMEFDIDFIKAKIFPYDPDDVRDDISKAIDELLKLKRLFVIEHKDEKLLFCPTLKNHQKIFHNEPAKFKIPQSVLADAENTGRNQLELNIPDAPGEPTENHSSTTREPLENQQSTTLLAYNLNSNLNLNLNSNLPPPPAPKVDFQSRGPTGTQPPKTNVNPKFKIGLPPGIDAPHPPTNPQVLAQLADFRKNKLMSEGSAS